MGELRRSVKLLLLGLIANAGNAQQSCSRASFVWPDLFGAEFTSLTAANVDSFKVNATSPEGLLIPSAGISLCNVTITYHHPGQNDETTVQVWLPDKWNGRFAGLGGGGYTAGNIDGEPLASAISLGYSASVTDAGHTVKNWSSADWVLQSPGNLNYPQLINFAWLSIHDMTVIGKSITKQFYGTAPKFSYFAGCSTGGRQAITSAQKYPDDYDGILAGSPAINMPDLSMSTFWPQSVMNRLGVYPTKCEFDSINRLSIEACDAIDGVKDGFIADPDACNFDPQTVVGQTVTCDNITIKISTDGASIARSIRQGPVGSDGRPLWVGTAHGTPFTGRLALANTNCSTGTCIGQPFPMAVSWFRDFVRKDPTYNITSMTIKDLELNYYLARQDLQSTLGGDDADLSKFKAGGKKMISWHGLSDECITMRGTRLYYDKVMQFDSQVKDYYRHFEAPGINHCAGPVGSYYPLRALSALARWVEGGIAPETLIGYNLPNVTNLESDPSATRPICMYPNVLRYRSGDTAAYGSFSCEAKNATAADPARSRDEL